jgi:hypothetical protein
MTGLVDRLFLAAAKALFVIMMLLVVLQGVIAVVGDTGFGFLFMLSSLAAYRYRERSRRSERALGTRQQFERVRIDSDGLGDSALGDESKWI